MISTTLFLLVIPLLGAVSVVSSRSIVPAYTQLQPQVQMQKNGVYKTQAHSADDCRGAFTWCIESGHYSHRFCLQGLQECIPVSAQLQPQVQIQEVYNEWRKIQAHAAQSDCGGAFRLCIESGMYSVDFCFQGLQLCPYT